MDSDERRSSCIGDCELITLGVLNIADRNSLNILVGREGEQ